MKVTDAAGDCIPNRVCWFKKWSYGKLTPAAQVAQAIFQRYPNPFARHVLSEDTTHRELIGPSTLYSRRCCGFVFEVETYLFWI